LGVVVDWTVVVADVDVVTTAALVTVVCPFVIVPVVLSPPPPPVVEPPKVVTPAVLLLVGLLDIPEGLAGGDTGAVEDGGTKGGVVLVTAGVGVVNIEVVSGGVEEEGNEVIPVEIDGMFVLLMMTGLGVGVSFLLTDDPLVALVGVGFSETVVAGEVDTSRFFGVDFCAVVEIDGARVGVGLIDVVVPLVGEADLDGVSLSLAGDTLELARVGVGRRLSVVPEVVGVWACLAGVIDVVAAVEPAGVWFCLAGLTMVVVLAGVIALREVVVASRRRWVVVVAGVVVVALDSVVGCLLGVVCWAPAHEIHTRTVAARSSRCKTSVISL